VGMRNCWGVAPYLVQGQIVVAQIYEICNVCMH